MSKQIKPTYVDFDHEKFQKSLGKYSLVGEVGVLSYKYSKIVTKDWKFSTPTKALVSAKKIYQTFLDDLKLTSEEELALTQNQYMDSIMTKFCRADICRKFLLMGFTRSMRYYYHKSGTKWGKNADGAYIILPFDHDLEKKASADIFKQYHELAKVDPNYLILKEYFKLHRKLFSTYNL